MSELLQVIVLAVFQGIAEFLPISSSGHLVLCKEFFRDFLNWSWTEDENGRRLDMLLDIVLHLGTLASILVIYRRDLLDLLRKRDFRLIGCVILATIPAVIVGVLFKKRIEATFESPLLVGFCLCVTAGLLVLGTWLEGNRFHLDRLPFPIAIIIGCFQAVSVVCRGVSRSGSTIVGGLVSGVDRVSATKFSFLMAIPAICGAGVMKLKDIFEEQSLPPIPWGHLAIGWVVSFAVGLASLTFLLKIVAKGKLHYFAWYCLTVGLLTIGWQLSKVPQEPTSLADPQEPVKIAIPMNPARTPR